MNFSEYQKKAHKTAQYPKISIEDNEWLHDASYLYCCLGLSGETGEVLEKIKKIVRNQKGIFLPEDLQEIRKELGDVLWYVSEIAYELGLDLNLIAKENIKKLSSRAKRNVIKSSGDNR